MSAPGTVAEWLEGSFDGAAGNLFWPQPRLPDNHSDIRSSQGFWPEIEIFTIPLLMALFYAVFAKCSST